MSDYLLHIETSGAFCSVALSNQDAILWYKQEEKVNNHAESLFLFLQEAFLQIPATDIKAVSVSAGPGSYTGLRIGVSAAKGICFGQKIPLIAIPTPQIMAMHPWVQNQVKPGDFIASCIDARRDEVFCAVLDHQAGMLAPSTAEVLSADFLKDYRLPHAPTLWFIGNANQKIKAHDLSGNIQFIENIDAKAEYMPLLAWRCFQEQAFADLAYFEPLYSKEFYTIKK